MIDKIKSYLPKRAHLFAVWAVFTLFAVTLRGGDAEASRLYNEGRKLYLAGEYYDAAAKFDESLLMANNPAIKANSLLAIIGAYRMCKLPYREFKAIEKLLDRYPDYADYKAMVSRQFEIGKAFCKGFREPAFWALRWISYLSDVDRTEEVYTTALRRSPYAAEAPQAWLELAYWYEMNGMTAKSLDCLRELIKKHPEAKEKKFAMLALGNGLFELAKRGGDGDGRIIAEALKYFQQVVTLYPGSREAAFAARKITASRDIQARHLAEVAAFYRRSGRDDAARRYLAKIMQEFPDSASAADAERTLVQLDSTYLPGDFPKRPQSRLPELHSFAIPAGAERELISPVSAGNTRFLLPVPDLKGGSVTGRGGK